MTKIKNINARHITRAIRAQIIASGAKRVCIHRDGRVDAFGVLPNTNKNGWYFAGFDVDIMRQIHREVAVLDDAKRT